MMFGKDSAHERIREAMANERLKLNIPFFFIGCLLETDGKTQTIMDDHEPMLEAKSQGRPESDAISTLQRVEVTLSKGRCLMFPNESTSPTTTRNA
jgi:hypothetical protein